MEFNSGFKGLNGLVRFVERRNLVSAHACAITFQTQSTTDTWALPVVGSLKRYL